MHNQLRIECGIQKGAEIRFLLTITPEHPIGIPSGKMITDSDELTFVYLLEEEEGYSPIHFTQAVWPLMVDVLKSDVDPILSWEDKELTLTGFKDELNMLIFNIEGNNNYGETFTQLKSVQWKKHLQRYFKKRNNR